MEEKDCSMFNRVARVCLGLGVVWALCQTTGGRYFFSGDANGDQQVDVRDLQQMVASVLHGRAEGAGADVNGDGKIDVLDVLALLEETTRANAPRHVPSAPGGQHEGALVLGASTARLVEPVRCVESFLDAIEGVCWPDRSGSVEPNYVLPRTERYVCCLISNAPPLFS
jgi:hypothetical protein